MTYDSLTNEHSVYIGTKTTTTNEFGESTETWSYSSTITKCRLSPISLSDRIEMGGRFEDIKYRGFFKSGTAIYLNSRDRKSVV